MDIRSSIGTSRNDMQQAVAEVQHFTHESLSHEAEKIEDSFFLRQHAGYLEEFKKEKSY